MSFVVVVGSHNVRVFRNSPSGDVEVDAFGDNEVYVGDGVILPPPGSGDLSLEFDGVIGDVEDSLTVGDFVTAGGVTAAASIGSVSGLLPVADPFDLVAVASTDLISDLVTGAATLTASVGLSEFAGLVGGVDEIGPSGGLSDDLAPVGGACGDQRIGGLEAVASGGNAVTSV